MVYKGDCLKIEGCTKLSFTLALVYFAIAIWVSDKRCYHKFLGSAT